MDAKSRDLALLALVSLFCAIFAWAGHRDVFGSVFFALGVVAMVGAAYGRRRGQPLAKKKKAPLSGRRRGLRKDA